MNQEWMFSLLGGVLIGISVSLMLLWNGRVTGISGIINSAFSTSKDEATWRWFFIGGLFLGGFVLRLVKPEVFTDPLTSNQLMIAVAGLLVGFGTIMGSGCTSGHGICGLSRLSARSIIATFVFIVAGVIAVSIFKKLGVY